VERPKLRLLQEPWRLCEEAIHAVGLHKIDALEKKIGASAVASVRDFLQEIGFLDNRGLNSIGSEFFTSKFLKNDDATAINILTEAIRKYEPTQALCQLLWGRPGLKRANLYELLVFEDYVDPRAVSEEDIGSFLMLLNHCGIIKFSKKTNIITITYNPRTEASARPLTKFLSPETPYSNLRNLWDTIRSCNGFVHWFDKHFPPKGLEPLHDESDGSRIREVKILTGIQNHPVMERLNRDFREFRDELRIRKISSELRVICDKHLLNDIHDRWIISENVCYNIPPVNSMLKGQYSELKETAYRPPFIEWWSKAVDVLDEWSAIDSYLSTMRTDKGNQIGPITPVQGPSPRPLTTRSVS
jgi:hypothetical protein